MIRLAEQRDRESVIAIYNQAIAATFQTAFTEPLGPTEGAEWFARHQGQAYPMFVYEQEETVVGWLIVIPYRSGRGALRYTVEISYFIHSSYQGKGIGRELIEYSLDACRQLGYKTILAIILDRNIPSIRLLEKFGFEKWGYLPGVADFDGTECNHVYYGLRL
jgi:L-amino acid N-acyltransferase YncA